MAIYSITHSSEKMISQGYRFVIYRGDWYGYHLFSSNKKKAFKRIIKKLGLKVDHVDDGITYYRQELKEFLFWKRAEIPHHAKKIKLLSNGSIVTGFILSNDKELFIYRPNPNAKRVYKPLSLKRHIRYSLKWGTF